MIEPADCEALIAHWQTGNSEGGVSATRGVESPDGLLATQGSFNQPGSAVAGTELEVEIYGARCRAVVQPAQAVYDPENARLTA